MQQRKRVQISFKDHPSMTIQSQAQSTDINYIVEQYAKTGMLPITRKHHPIYGDETIIPDFETMHYIKQDALEAFAQLPKAVRDACNNNPANYEAWLSDPENTDSAIKYGLLEAVEPPTPKTKPEAEPKKELKPNEKPDGTGAEG